jgi:hypothetical protein
MLARDSAELESLAAADGVEGPDGTDGATEAPVGTEPVAIGSAAAEPLMVPTVMRAISPVRAAMLTSRRVRVSVRVCRVVVTVLPSVRAGRDTGQNRDAAVRAIVMTELVVFAVHTMATMTRPLRKLSLIDPACTFRNPASPTPGTSWYPGEPWPTERE